MTAEEAELTFIRCPSCRSLIPAIATRCRMCGHQFEKGANQGTPPAGASGEDGAPARPRVRQRTASTSPSEVEALRAQQASMDSLDEPEPVLSKAPSWQQFVSGQNPLPDDDIDSTYLNESQQSGDESDSQAQSSWDENDEGGEEDDFESEGETEADADVFGQGPEGGRQGKRRRRRRRKRKGNGLLQTEGGAAAPQQAAPESPSFENDFASPAGRTGTSSWKMSEGQGFGSPSDLGGRADPGADMEGPSDQEAWTAESTKLEEKVDVMQEAFESGSGKESTKRAEERWDSSSLVTEERVSGDGMLIGWLVSFREDNKGRAVEIRAGRCFIGRGQLRNSDVVFSHESISTPHGMLVASESEGFSFQDLMSERGTFVLRAGAKANDWSQVMNTTVLNHGDRVRFGDYEVVVVLLPR